MKTESDIKENIAHFKLELKTMRPDDYCPEEIWTFQGMVKALEWVLS